MKKFWILITGATSALVAVIATSCCIIPILFVSIGLGGAWMANLADLEPYRPYFLTLAVISMGITAWLYWKPSKSCDSCPPKKWSRTVVLLTLIFLGFLIVLALALPTIEPYLLKFINL